jgi:hypothetical protein
VIANGRLVLTSDGARDGVCGSDLQPCSEISGGGGAIRSDAFDGACDLLP